MTILCGTMYLCKLIDNKHVYMLWQCLYTFGITSLAVLIPVVCVRVYGPKNINAIYSMNSGLVVI